MRIASTVVLASLLMACSASGIPAEGTMCEAARSLSAAKTLVEQAAAKDASGDKAGAQDLANAAFAHTTEAHDALQGITSSEVKRGATWQALLDADLHIAQAAAALLPAYDSYGMTAEELAAGAKSLQMAGLLSQDAC